MSPKQRYLSKVGPYRVRESSRVSPQSRTQYTAANRHAGHQSSRVRHLVSGCPQGSGLGKAYRLHTRRKVTTIARHGSAWQSRRCRYQAMGSRTACW